MWWVGTPGAAVLAAGDFGGGETETHGFGFWILRTFCGALMNRK